jgi:hypothetical protein
LLNQWSEFNEENNLHNMLWVCVLVVINMHSYTCALKAVVMKRDRCIYKNIVWKYSNLVCSPCTRSEERKSAKVERSSTLVIYSQVHAENWRKRSEVICWLPTVIMLVL